MTLGINIRDFGFSPKFTEWRHGQEDAILECVGSNKRFMIQVQPTGSGKSICYMTIAKLLGVRTLILTSTKILQEQISKDFPEVAVIKGKSSYPCKLVNGITNCDEAPCRLYRYSCGYRHSGCNFYDAVKKANNSQIVITNYAFQSHNNFNSILGDFDFLICDEGHDVTQQLLGTLCTTVSNTELQYLCVDTTDSDEQIYTDLIRSKKFIKDSINDIVKDATKAGNLSSLINDRKYRFLDTLSLKLDKISARGQWVLEKTTKGIDIDPLWPRHFAETHLFRNIPKILLTSATFNIKMVSLLGIRETEYDYVEYSSYFPIKSRPIIHIPTVSLRAKLDQDSINLWLLRIDQIIANRLDRKGVIHAVSYERCKLILENSKYREMMISHRPGKVEEAVDKLKKSFTPKILVSPTCVTGIDLPYTDCEYQIIGKVPFPDLRRRVDQIRKESDKDYGMMLAIQNIQQAVGRGMRASDDQCENLVIDDQFKWFPWKYQSEFNKWFMEAIKTSYTIPMPLPKLDTHRK